MSLIYIKEVSNKDGSITIYAEGGLDSTSIPALEKVLKSYYNKKCKIYLEIQNLHPITRAGREFLNHIKNKAILMKIPKFIKLDD